jgi:hypothetical protein
MQMSYLLPLLQIPHPPRPHSPPHLSQQAKAKVVGLTLELEPSTLARVKALASEHSLVSELVQERLVQEPMRAAGKRQVVEGSRSFSPYQHCKHYRMSNLPEIWPPWPAHVQEDTSVEDQ